MEKSTKGNGSRVLFLALLLAASWSWGDAYVAIQDPIRLYPEPELVVDNSADLKRVLDLSNETFTSDGLWIFGDPDHATHYADQMKALGWK